MRTSMAFLGLIVCVGTVRSQDEVRFRDTASGREQSAQGTILEETPTEIVMRGSPTGPSRRIAAVDVVDVVHEVPGGVKLAYNRGRNEEKRALDLPYASNERTQVLMDAYKSLQEVLVRLTQDKLRFASRQVRYRQARLLTHLAEGQPKNRSAAIDAMEKFVREEANAWQAARAARLLLGLYQDEKADKKILELCDTLAARAELGNNVRTDFAAAAIDALLASGNMADAKNRIAKLPTEPRGRLYQFLTSAHEGNAALAKDGLEKQLAQAKEGKAAASIALGDCYLRLGDKQQALWAYLWVDVVYCQDAFERGRAQRRLARLFAEMGEPDRANKYRDLALQTDA